MSTRLASLRERFGFPTRTGYQPVTTEPSSEPAEQTVAAPTQDNSRRTVTSRSCTDLDKRKLYKATIYTSVLAFGTLAGLAVYSVWPHPEDQVAYCRKNKQCSMPCQASKTELEYWTRMCGWWELDMPAQPCVAESEVTADYVWEVMKTGNVTIPDLLGQPD